MQINNSKNNNNMTNSSNKLQYFEIVQKLANATVTFWKSMNQIDERENDKLVQHYEKQIIELGYKLPNRDKLFQIGIYKANGSF